MQMLCRTEENVPADTPVAFPIFGRGRLLGAFHGELLNADEVEGACAFLTGMCSCQAKEMNPGTDLLFTAGWFRLFREGFEAEAALPELVGTSKPEQKPASTQPGVAPLAPRRVEPTKPIAQGNSILRNVFIAAGLSVLGVMAISLVLWRRSKRT